VEDSLPPVAALARARLLTVREVADWLAISETWVRDHAAGRRRPALPAIRLGKSMRFNETAVSQWLLDMSKLASAQKGKAAW
jgi:excisionase family DNA binding protein